MIDLHYAPDNASLIIRIILEELSIAYRTVLIDRSVDEQSSDAYRKLNPKGQIPVCVIDGQAVFETAAIALTLSDSAAIYGRKADALITPSLTDSRRSQFLKWLFYLTNTIHNELRPLFYPEKYAGIDIKVQETCQALTRERLLRGIAIIDAEYSCQKTAYLFSDRPSIVDIYLAVCMRWVQLYPLSSRGWLDPKGFPAIYEMLECLQGRSAVIAACRKEGISGQLFSCPDYANPPEGSAL